MRNEIAIVRFEKSLESLQKAIELCHGFAGLKKDARVLIKPNLVTYHKDIEIPPFGVYTTTLIIESLIKILQNQIGISKISIGEGSVKIMSPSPTSPESSVTKEAFEGLGYTRLAKQYNIALIDFDDSAEVVIKTPDGIPMKIAKDALECDFFINVPVLKTHSQTMVSLGIKNLKGCLKIPSKKLCHDPLYGLNHTFQFLPDFIKPSLTIIDGIYSLDGGPIYGKGVRTNLIIASTDVLGADIAAAKCIGHDAVDIPHLKEYADRKHLPLNLAKYTLLGEDINSCITPLKWDWAWTKENTGPEIFTKLGIKNIALPKYNTSLCSGCSPLSYMLNLFVMSAPKNVPIPKIEVLNGKSTEARAGFDHTVLLGNCIITKNAKNPNINDAVKVPGCPPEYGAVVSALKQCGLQFDENAYENYLKKTNEKLASNPQFDRRMYR